MAWLSSRAAPPCVMPAVSTCFDVEDASHSPSGTAASSPAITTRSCAGAPGQTMTSPASKETCSNLSMTRFCCDAVRWRKKSRSLDWATLSTRRDLMALRRRTSSTGPRSLSKERFPRARQVTESTALAPKACCLLYMRAAPPRMVPGFLTSESLVCTLPSMRMNMQGETSPARRICSPRRNICTEHAPARSLCSSSFMVEKVGSILRNRIALCMCFSDSLCMQSRKYVPSIFQRLPAWSHVTAAVRFTLYSRASSPNVCFARSCFTPKLSTETVKVPLWMMYRLSP
mmetsp:Transcript_22297/g.63270  ORF Transcript_22297/g.63270 Transcript_22297/m.63270 type:complete len:287 (+) Transcript_22297:715-1575(+)